VVLKFFGKTLAIAKIVCYKRMNFGKSPSLAAFFTKDSSVCPFKHDGVIKRNWWAGNVWALASCRQGATLAPSKNSSCTWP
jgi:hypothetical protein